MKTLSFLLFFVLTSIVLINPSQANDQSTLCYATAWDHPGNGKGGLGLTAGQAIELCKGAPLAKEVLQCYRTAWDHPGNGEGGLGLTAGQAIEFCKQ